MFKQHGLSIAEEELLIYELTHHYTLVKIGRIRTLQEIVLAGFGGNCLFLRKVNTGV